MDLPLKMDILLLACERTNLTFIATRLCKMFSEKRQNIDGFKTRDKEFDNTDTINGLLGRPTSITALRPIPHYTVW